VKPAFIRAVLAAVAMVLLCAGGVAARTITLVADEWPPFNASPEADRKGYMVDIATEVFERLGYTVEYRTMPWTRALAGVLSGEYDGVIGVTRFEAQGFVLPSENLGLDQLAIYTRKDASWRFEGIPSLEAVLLGVIKGYGYVPPVADYIAGNQDNPKRIHMNSGNKPLERLLRMLMLGRIDAVLDTEASIRFVARELGVLESIRPAGRLDGAEPLYIAFSPAASDARELAGHLSEGIRRLRHSGRLASILGHYSLEDWAPLLPSDSESARQSRDAGGATR
jgi:polar amino acid transport system substrate-binding protein